MTDLNDRDDKMIGELLRAEGERPRIPEEDFRSIKREAEAVWRERYAEPAPASSFRRFALPLAAAVLGGLVLTWWLVRATPERAVVAHVEWLSGEVIAVQPQTEKPMSLTERQPLHSGTRIETRDDSRVAFRLSSGPSLRIDAGSRVHFTSENVVILDRGAVYVDSSNGPAVTIRTGLGDFQPVGTQFEVRVDASRSARLRVRDGRVRVLRKDKSIEAVAGEEIRVDTDGSILRSSIRPDDPSWAWTTEASPVFAIEGRTLRDFLEWIARENGWRLQFASPQADSLSKTITLHGSTAGQTAVEALQTVTLSSGFGYTLNNGVLTVRVVVER